MLFLNTVVPIWGKPVSRREHNMVVATKNLQLVGAR